MTCTRRKASIKTLLLGGLAAGTMLATPALAQDAAAPKRVIDGEKILQLLVAKGVIKQSDADGIIAQATVEAPAAPVANAVVAGGVSGDTQIVPYIPEGVRDQIKAELRSELASQAEAQGWSKPGEVAEWTKRITLSGDVRVRGEGTFFNSRNAPDIVNFSAINAGAPYDVNENTNRQLAPVLNSTRDRQRVRIRARLGIAARLTDAIGAELRVATGNDTSPVSTNQTLGGGNGDFSKYNLWLDRANIQIAPHGALEGLRFVAGRAANPFWTSEILFDRDINFDGFSLGYRRAVAGGLTISATGGAFPTFNTDLNFGSRLSGGNDTSGTYRSDTRWLLAGQLGAAYEIDQAAKVSAAVGYFHFSSAQGIVSTPCDVDAEVCDTDNRRPLFQQYGNTVYPIRAYLPNFDVTVPDGFTPERQYFGLASEFHVLAVQGAVDLDVGGRIPVRVEGGYVKNLAFKRDFLNLVQTNVLGDYHPSGTGWTGAVTVGQPDPRNWGEWKLFAAYRRIGSDAAIDAFTDSEFHLGGTNAKGYILGGALGVGGGAEVGLRWLSADELTGQPYGVDLLQLDLTAKF